MCIYSYIFEHKIIFQSCISTNSLSFVYENTLVHIQAVLYRSVFNLTYLNTFLFKYESDYS